MTDNDNELTTTDAKPVREGRISKRLAEAIRLLLTGEVRTQKAAALRVGLTEGYFSEALRKPHVRVFLERRTRETLAAGTMRASARMIELLDAGSEHVAFDASRHLLGIAGIKPSADAQVSVNIDIKAGYVIDLSEDSRPTVDVTPARPGSARQIEQQKPADPFFNPKR
ncbi:MAG TPA: hypothetical protein VFB02_16480 [Bradyrhizobium sp.]|nr:hypothetical protein [Bradyrhizobium sp.]